MYQFERWRNEIQSAASESDVASALRKYAASILPSDIAALPPAVHEVLSRADADIPGNAVELVRQELRFHGDAEARAVLNEIAHTFIVASSRLGQIHQGRFMA